MSVESAARIQSVLTMVLSQLRKIFPTSAGPIRDSVGVHHAETRVIYHPRRNGADEKYKPGESHISVVQSRLDSALKGGAMYDGENRVHVFEERGRQIVQQVPWRPRYCGDWSVGREESGFLPLGYK